MSQDIGKARTHGSGSGPFAFPVQAAPRRARGTLRRMADKDPEGDGPSLELPSFGFGRTRRTERHERAQTTGPEVGAESRPEPTPVAPADTRVRPATRVADPADEPPRARREVRLPSLPALPAVLLVGAVVGMAAVLMTYGSLRLCDAATGTASCGGGPGLLMLLAILIALTYLGGWLLRGFGISDAGSTSFLAVGLVAVVAMLFLVDSLDEWSGAVLVPVVTVLAYALSWRVTATLVDASADQQ